MSSRLKKLFLACLLFALPLVAGSNYIAPDSINLFELLPPPPKAGSVEEKRDLQGVLALQESRTKEQSEKAIADASLNIFRFSDVLGESFNEKNLPLTAALFAKIKDDGNKIAHDAKDKWMRPRPFLASSDVHSLMPDTKGAAYPSGHTTFAYESAIILSHMIPEKRNELFIRAEEYAQNRILLGVHYPLDIRAGRTSGTLVANALLHDDKFLHDLAAATEELRRALGYPPLH